MKQYPSRMIGWRATFAGAACLFIAGSSQAQSVTLYGLIDTAVEHLSSTAAGGSLTRMPGLTAGLPSRLGVRGSEDLGDGLKAVFTLEQGLAPDSGALNQGGRGWGRQAFVGLAGSWGTISLGRQYTMTYWSQLDADLLGPAMYSSSSLDSYLPNARADNAVAYRGTFDSLTVGGTYSLGRDAVNAGPSPSGTNCAGESSTDTLACREWSVMLKYDRPTWGASAAIDEQRGGPGAFAGLTSSAMKDRRSILAGWFKPDQALKLGVGLIARRNDGSPATPRSNLWYAGAAYTLDQHWLLEAEAFRLGYKDSANGATLLAVRASYLFSKRTTVYATAGHIANDGALALSASGAAAGGTPVAGGSQTGLALGLRHSF